MKIAVKVSTPPEELYTVNIIPIRIPVEFSKQILKWETNSINNTNFKWKHTKRYSQRNLGQRNKDRSTLLDFKIYYRAAEIKIVVLLLGQIGRQTNLKLYNY